MEVERIAGYFEEKILEFKPDLCSVVLFGSRATTAEEYGKGSDIDMLLIFDTLDDDAEQRLSKLKFEASLKFGISIDVVPLTKDDFELNIRNKMPLFLEIWRKHKVIFDRGNYFMNKTKEIDTLVKTGKLSFNPWINCWMVKS